MLKEAYLKALGIGIAGSGGLRGFGFQLEGWSGAGRAGFSGAADGLVGHPGAIDGLTGSHDTADGRAGSHDAADGRAGAITLHHDTVPPRGLAARGDSAPPACWFWLLRPQPGMLGALCLQGHDPGAPRQLRCFDVLDGDGPGRAPAAAAEVEAVGGRVVHVAPPAPSSRL